MIIVWLSISLHFEYTKTYVKFGAVGFVISKIMNLLLIRRLNNWLGVKCLALRRLCVLHAKLWLVSWLESRKNPVLCISLRTIHASDEEHLLWLSHEIHVPNRSLLDSIVLFYHRAIFCQHDRCDATVTFSNMIFLLSLFFLFQIST